MIALTLLLFASSLALYVRTLAPSVATLFDDIAPKFKERPGGYTRITKLGQRRSDGSEMAILEWVGVDAPDKKRKTEKKEAEAAS